jgi:hypothetical protein
VNFQPTWLFFFATTRVWATAYGNDGMRASAFNHILPFARNDSLRACFFFSLHSVSSDLAYLSGCHSFN